MAKKQALLIFLVGVTVLGLAASNVASAAETVKIGFIGAYVGPALKMSKDAEQAAVLAVEKVNQAGGVLGRKIEMIIRDGGEKPELHARQAREMITQDKVLALFGGGASSCVLAASAVAKELKTPFLVSVGNSSAIVWENGHRYAFLFEPNSVMEGKAWVEWAAQQPWKSYAWIGPDYEWSRTTLKTFQDQMAAKGVKITMQKDLWHKLGETSFTSYIPILKASQAEVLFIGTWGSSLNALILQGLNAGLFEKMKAFGLISEDVAMSLGDKLPSGLYGFSRAEFTYFAEKYPAGKEFVDTFYKRFGIYPGGFSFCAYDSIIAYAEAIKKANSLEAEKVVDALKGLKFKGPRGERYIRAVDGQEDTPVCIGPRMFKKEYGFAVLDPVTIIPAEKTWISEDEAKAKRGKE
ncbi:MAG: ABC transporter substrate-binding protein [Thermodesulfobacteriota bacterium]